MNKKHLRLVEEEESGYFTAYSVGIVCASVCTDMDVEEATERLNQEVPLDGDLVWALSKDKTFRGGEPMPGVCEQDPSRMHYLFNC